MLTSLPLIVQLICLKICYLSFIRVTFTARKRSLGQSNIFRSMCQEFCPQEGPASVHAAIPPPRPAPPLPTGPDTPQSRACWEIRSTNGRYASYWNAFLFYYVFWKVFTIKYPLWNRCKASPLLRDKLNNCNNNNMGMLKGTSCATVLCTTYLSEQKTARFTLIVVEIFFSEAIN